MLRIDGEATASSLTNGQLRSSNCNYCKLLLHLTRAEQLRRCRTIVLNKQVILEHVIRYCSTLYWFFVWRAITLRLKFSFIVHTLAHSQPETVVSNTVSNQVWHQTCSMTSASTSIGLMRRDRKEEEEKKCCVFSLVTIEEKKRKI